VDRDVQLCGGVECGVMGSGVWCDGEWSVV
jgi:hypothetical protein